MVVAHRLSLLVESKWCLWLGWTHLISPFFLYLYCTTSGDISRSFGSLVSSDSGIMPEVSVRFISLSVKVLVSTDSFGLITIRSACAFFNILSLFFLSSLFLMAMALKARYYGDDIPLVVFSVDSFLQIPS